MHYYNYKKLKDVLSQISNVDYIKIIDVEDADCINEIISDYTVTKNDDKYYTVYAKLDELTYINVLIKLEKTNIEEVELYNAEQKKYYINFCEKIVQFY